MHRGDVAAISRLVSCNRTAIFERKWTYLPLPSTPCSTDATVPNSAGSFLRLSILTAATVSSNAPRVQRDND